jgi:translation initiation factor 1
MMIFDHVRPRLLDENSHEMPLRKLLGSRQDCSGVQSIDDSMASGQRSDVSDFNNPFVDLNGAVLPPGSSKDTPRKSRGRVDIIRVRAGRGGKTVTVVQDFVGIGLPEKERLAKEIQKTCGVGGTVKEGRIEIQGDKRDEVARILTNAGFAPVFAGG